MAQASPTISTRLTSRFPTELILAVISPTARSARPPAASRTEGRCAGGNSPPHDPAHLLVNHSALSIPFFLRSGQPMPGPDASVLRTQPGYAMGGTLARHSHGPHRLAWPRTPLFQGGNAGSNPAGVTIAPWANRGSLPAKQSPRPKGELQPPGNGTPVDPCRTP